MKTFVETPLPPNPEAARRLYYAISAWQSGQPAKISDAFAGLTEEDKKQIAWEYDVLEGLRLSGNQRPREALDQFDKAASQVKDKDHLKHATALVTGGFVALTMKDGEDAARQRFADAKKLENQFGSKLPIICDLRRIGTALVDGDIASTATELATITNLESLDIAVHHFGLTPNQLESMAATLEKFGKSSAVPPNGPEVQKFPEDRNQQFAERDNRIDIYAKAFRARKSTPAATSESSAAPANGTN